MPGCEIEIINMNEPYLCLLHAREILLLVVLTIHNDQIPHRLQNWSNKGATGTEGE